MSTPNSPFLLPVNQVFSEDWKEFLIQFTKLYADISRNTNARDIATYDLSEVTDGQQWYTPGNTQVKRSNFRKVVRYPGALVLGPNTQAHGVAVGNPTTFVFTRIQGVIFRQGAPNPLFVPVPNDDIHLEVNDTNVVLTIPAAYVGFFCQGIVLEYVKTS